MSADAYFAVATSPVECAESAELAAAKDAQKGKETKNKNHDGGISLRRDNARSRRKAHARGRALSGEEVASVKRSASSTLLHSWARQCRRGAPSAETEMAALITHSLEAPLPGGYPRHARTLFSERISVSFGTICFARRRALD